VLVAAGVRDPDAITVPLLAAALVGQIVAETLGWLIHDRSFGIAALRAQLGEMWVHGVDLALSPVGYVAALTVSERPWTVLALLPLIGVLAVFSREREARLESILELNQAYRGTALVLGDVVEADDGYTGEHSRGVVSLALAVGDRLGLDGFQRRNLEFGALLHDVGKVAIPKEIINKPGKLDPAEWTIIKTHTVEGQRMLDRVGGFMRTVGLIVRSHHERWDGGGYPDGLAGEQIPLEARIISCCDSWNAMTTTRSYRAAMPLEAAVAEIRAGAGGQFDPRVAEVLLATVGAGDDTGTAAGAPAAVAA
jgi:putative nucleotidyltransferase with HDIG domain